MCEEDSEVWQVAGNRRRTRHRRATERRSSRSSKTGQAGEGSFHHVSKTAIPTITATTVAEDGVNANSGSRGKRAGRRRQRETHKGYSYKTDNSCRQQQQEGDQTEEEAVKQQLRKLEHVRTLLKDTALWKQLTEGLRYTILPEIQLAASLAVVGSPLVSIRGSEVSEFFSIGGALERQDREVDDGHLCISTHADGQAVVESAEHQLTSKSAAQNQRQDDQERPSSSSFGPDQDKHNATKGAAFATVSPGGLCELVCYGIGNFTESHSSMYQLALALCLRDFLFAKRSSAAASRAVEGCTEGRAEGGADREGHEDSGDGGSTPRRMLVFDPIMGDLEKALLVKLGCDVLVRNEEGKRCCGSGTTAEKEASSRGDRQTRPTLFFMPHCPQRLYSNVLWANWSSAGLGSIVILGNKLSSYRDRMMSQKALSDPTNALLRVEPLLDEIDLLPYGAVDKARWKVDTERLPRLEQAFSDLTLSFSTGEARKSAKGEDALRHRPLEFVEAADGELVTGRVEPSLVVDS